MKKIIIAFSLLFLTAFIYFQQTNEPKTNSKNQTINTHLSTEKVRTNLKSLKYQITNNSPDQFYSFSKECSESMKNLTELNSEEIFSQLSSDQNLENLISLECQNSLKKNELFLKLSKSFQCNLFEKELLKSTKSFKDKCAGLFMVLKAYTINDLSSHRSTDQLSGEELAARFVKMFFEIDSLTKDKFIENNKMIELLYEKYPNDTNVIEAYLGYLMIGGMITKYNAFDSIINEILADHLGENFRIDRLKIIKHVAKDKFENAKKTLEELLQLYPKEPELQYYYAAYYWNQNDRSQSLKHLDQAIRLSNNCAYCVPDSYKETRKKIETAQLGDKKLFALSIGLNFENL
jgi:hypothetical protein